MTSPTAPPLPHWPALPDDRPAAVRAFKAAARARFAARGRSVDEVVAAAEARVRAAVDDVVATRRRGEPVWPVLDYADIEAGRVTDEQRAHVRRRGCAVVRGHFDRQQALAWDQGIMDYVGRNRFFETYRGPGDDFFRSGAAKPPEIFPIYWSPAQVEARQSDRMATVQRFLNAHWTSESEGVRWFDPTRDALYPDRIRRRPPGVDARGLGNHVDSGKLDLWMTQENQRAFRHVWDGTVESFDPWDASHRTTGPQHRSTTMCSAYRTFQGWTALSDMDHDQGVLHTIPIPEAIAYLLLRPLLADVPDDDMCGVDANRAFAVTPRWHEALLEASTGIPDVRAGDSVWWHSDMVHSVAPVEDQQGWGNVMYIPAAPWCLRNERYAPDAFESFVTGSSPRDFPAEHYEREWVGRPSVADLNPAGRRGFGLD